MPRLGKDFILLLIHYDNGITPLIICTLTHLSFLSICMKKETIVDTKAIYDCTALGGQGYSSISKEIIALYDNLLQIANPEI